MISRKSAPLTRSRSAPADPKPENYDSDKLRDASSAWSSRQKDDWDAEAGSHRGADSAALRQAESGTKISDIWREHGISEATYYIWKKQYAGLGLSELRELRQLREENGKLKRLVAHLSLDRHMLQEIVRKKL